MKMLTNIGVVDIIDKYVNFQLHLHASFFKTIFIMQGITYLFMLYFTYTKMFITRKFTNLSTLWLRHWIINLACVIGNLQLVIYWWKVCIAVTICVNIYQLNENMCLIVLLRKFTSYNSMTRCVWLVLEKIFPAIS
jgi:hypothetical protein